MLRQCVAFALAKFSSSWAAMGLVLGFLLLGLSVPLAWLTHVIVCISAKTWALLLIGALFFPIGIIHGYGIWLGIWH